VLSSTLGSPEDTFGVLRNLLQGLEARLRTVRGDVERQEVLAGATPSIWPTEGWLTGSFGRRSDPFSGAPAFHEGIDISTGKGRPVYATANGEVQSAARSGEYGNLVVLKHDFGLATRYGHLSQFNVKPGDIVSRRDWLRGIDRSIHGHPRPLRDPGQRQADQPAATSHSRGAPLAPRSLLAFVAFRYNQGIALVHSPQ
jgi:hypothetical protein